MVPGGVAPKETYVVFPPSDDEDDDDNDDGEGDVAALAARA
jgi:hypothetical protein